MPRPLSAQSEQDDASDALLFEEYERLNNQLRILQNERVKQTEEIGAKLGKQKKTIELLEKENDEIKCLLNLVDSQQNRKHDMKCIEKLKEALNQQDALYKQTEELKTYENKLDNEIRKLGKLIQEKQQERCVQARQETDQAELQTQIDKKVETMENNLYEKNVKFCTALAKNEELRSWIECSRNERNIYSSIYEKLSEKLKMLNQLKAKLTHFASVAYDQRTEAKNKNNIIKEKNEKDNAAFEMEIKELQRIIDHNDYLYQFMMKKSNERLEWKKEAESRIKKYGSTGEIARKQRNQKIQEYDQAMTELKQITNKDDVEQMIRCFKRNEDDNFTLFNYVTELNNQVETLNDNILTKQKEIDSLKVGQTMGDQERHGQMHDLEVQMNADKMVADEAQLHIKHVSKVLDEVKSQIKDLTIKLGCDVTKIVDMLGTDGDKVTERNLVMYLTALEQRVDDLLSVKYFAQVNGQVDDMNHDDLKAMLSLNLYESPKSNRDVTLALPSLMDEDETMMEEEMPISSERPLTQAELFSRATKELQRLESKYDLSSTKSYHRTSSPVRKSKMKI